MSPETETLQFLGSIPANVITLPKLCNGQRECPFLGLILSYF
jgi:hypothetical protein